MGTAWHLVRRFVGSLSPRRPSSSQADEVRSVLGDALFGLWQTMSPADQRHSVGVLRTVRSVAPDAPDWVCQAAILHDVGKVESNLGVVGRTAATVARPLRRRVAMPSAFATYWDHPRRGHDLILGSGGDGRVATWAAEHHRDPDQWTLPQNWALVLKQSDDD